MKTKTYTTKAFILLTYCILQAQVMKAQNPTFAITLTNDVQVSPKELQFDIYLLHTGGAPVFELSAHQYGISYNNAICDSGTITASLVPGSSTLTNPNQINDSPYTIAIANHQIRILSPSSVGIGNGSIISQTAPGTRIARIQVINTMPFAANTTADLAWNFTSVPLGQATSTHLAGYVSNVNASLITNSSNCFVTTSNPVLNPVPVGYFIPSAPNAPGINATLLPDGILDIQFYNLNQEDKFVQLYNLHGALCISHKCDKSLSSAQLNVSTLKEGIYIAAVGSGQNHFSKKVMIMK